jgi:hypothetical protein
MKDLKRYWRAILALFLMPIAFYFNLVEFFFALLFLFWSIQGIKSGMATLIDTVLKSDSPVLFWTINIMWIVISLMSLTFSEPIMTWYYGY